MGTPVDKKREKMSKQRGREERSVEVMECGKRRGVRLRVKKRTGFISRESRNKRNAWQHFKCLEMEKS